MKDYYKEKYSDLLDDYYELTNKYLELEKELLKFVEVKKTDERNVKNIPDKILDPFYTLKEVINRVESFEKNQERILEHLGMNKQDNK